MSAPVIAFVGKSNSGKTTLIETLIPLLVNMGLRVATVKQTTHDVEMDRPGKDTMRHRTAGAETVLLASDNRLFLARELPRPLSLREIAGQYLGDGYDLVLAEGFKQADVAKIEVHRSERSETLLFGEGEAPGRLLAVVSDRNWPDLHVPSFHLNDADGVAELILNSMNRR